MPQPLHSLLRRQLKRCWGRADDVPSEWLPLIQAVNDAYHEFDNDRSMLERSLDLSSVELIQANSDLRESEQRYRTFLDATTDMAFIKDAEFRYVVVNEANRAFFGRAMEEIVGKTDHDLMPEPMADACRESDQRAIAQNTVVITQEQVGDRIYETRKYPLRAKSGSMGVCGFIRDITEHKRAEMEIRDLLAQSDKARVALLGILEDEKRAENEMKEGFEELRRWHSVTLGREDRILELKREVNELAARLGEAARYGSAETP